MRAVFADRTDEALEHYPGGDADRDKAAARALGGDLAVGQAMWAWLEAQRATGRAPIYRYRFDRAPLAPDQDAGAFHAAEIVYVFDNLRAAPWRTSPDDQKVAELASGYWVNFVRTGDPNRPGLPEWPSYRQEGDPLMHLDVTATARRDANRPRHVFLAEVEKARRDVAIEAV